MPNCTPDLSQSRKAWRRLPRLMLVLSLVLLFGCTGDVTVTYNPLTHIATLTGKVRGKSKRITVAGTNCPGTITINDPDCGKITVTCSCTGVTTTTIECGDPLIAQIPNTWTYQDGSYTGKAGSSGKILVSDAGAFRSPTRGPIVTEPGYKAVVAKADAVFPNGDELDVKATFATGTDASAVTLKAIQTAIVTFDQGGKTCAEPALEIADTELAPDFRMINDAAHRLAVKGTSLPEMPSSARTSPRLLVILGVAVLVLVVVLILVWRKRSASTSKET